MVRTKLDPGTMYEAWQGAVGLIDGVEVTVQAGERRRGSDPVVQHLGPAVFVADGEPRRPTVFDAGIAVDEAQAVAAPAPPAPKVDPKTPLGELWYCHTEVLSSPVGPCRVGTIVRTGDPLLSTGTFQPLIERL